MHPDRASCTPQPEERRSGLFVVNGRRPRPAARHHTAPPGSHQKPVRQPWDAPGDPHAAAQQERLAERPG
eukprot:6894849-Heterocapsa_arctica.AAC.1